MKATFLVSRTFWMYPESGRLYGYGLGRSTLIRVPGNVWLLDFPGFFFRLGCSLDATDCGVRWQELLVCIENVSRSFTRCA